LPLTLSHEGVSRDVGMHVCRDHFVPDLHFRNHFFRLPSRSGRVMACI
jgi:hypothetical protein